MGMMIRVPKRENKLESPKSLNQISQDLKDGWRKVLHDRNLRIPLIHLMTISGGITFLFVLAPMMANELLHKDVEEATPLVLIPATIGIVLGLGGLKFFEKRKSKESLITIGIIATGISTACIPLLHFLPLSLKSIALFFLIALITFFNPFVSVTAMSFLQERTPPNYRGRVFGVMNMLFNRGNSRFTCDQSVFSE